MPDRFYRRQDPEPARAPRLLVFNRALASELGLDSDAIEPEAAHLFSGNQPPSDAWPIALAYAGDQFGHFVPQLGDGRALLLGELRDCHGNWRELQWKGSGRTPFSRQGDGRAWIGPVLREYLISEAMHHLRIPTTRSLAAVATGEPVSRERILPGAVLTRVASSHVRVGSFQYFAARQDLDAVRRLIDFSMRRHEPELADTEQPGLELLKVVMEKQASLIARWMGVGFLHGVMNTDNMAISGETIDFGPCAFLDRYDPETVFSSIDQWGRYAFGAQPGIGEWNLGRLAEALLPLLHRDIQVALQLAGEVVEGFADRFTHHWGLVMRAKLGLTSVEPEDRSLIADLLDGMRAGGADYTLTFRRLSDAAENPTLDHRVTALFESPESIAVWLPAWRTRLGKDPCQPPGARTLAMRQVNPARIPRNQRVESVLETAIAGEMQPFFTLLEQVSQPYEDLSAFDPDNQPPPVSLEPYQTFCGT
ncbi:MAG: YdiU family protein [Magnetococcus sp. YQC-9]